MLANLPLQNTSPIENQSLKDSKNLFYKKEYNSSDILTHLRLAFKAHLKHVIILCGEGELAFGCIFF